MELTPDRTAKTIASKIDIATDLGFAEAIDQAGHAVVITDPNGTILYVNAAFSKLTGYSREEAIGGNPRVLKSGKQDPDYYQDLWQTVQAGRTWHGELINRRKDGSEYTEEMTIAPVLDSNGQIVRHIAVKQDVTEHRTAQNAQAFLAAIVESSDDAIISTSRGLITSWNKGAVAIFGYSVNEAIGSPISMLIPPDRHSDMAHIDGALEDGHGVCPYETVRMRKDGRLIDVSLNVSPLSDAAGRTVGAVGIGRDISQRLLADQVVRDGAERFRTLFEHSADCIYIHDFNGNFLDANPAALKMLGYEREDIPSLNFTSLFGADQVPGIRQSLQEFALTGVRNRGNEFKVKRKDGAWLDIETKITLIPFEGNTRAILGVARDITARKQEEGALRESEERFHNMADGCPSPMWVTDAEGGIRFVNRTFRETFGVTYEQVEARNWQLLLHPDDAEEYVEALQRAVRERKPLKAETRVRCCGGEWRWFASYAEPRWSPSGEFLGHVGLSPDVTESKQAQKALRESEERFRNMADGCPAPMWVTDAEGGNCFVNRSYRESFGVTNEQMEARNWQLLLHPEDAAGYNEAFQYAIRERKPFKAETRVRGCEGEWHWFASYAEPRWSPSGEFLGHVGLSPDITESRNAEQAIRDSQDLAQSTIDALSSHVCVLNEAGTILTVNQAWRDFAAANRSGQVDCDAFGVGTNYLAVCDRTVGPEAADAAAFAAGIRAVLQGAREQYSAEYSCHSPDTQRWFIGRVTRFSIDRVPRVLIEHINITERKLGEQVLQRSEEKFRQLAENVREVFWMMDCAATSMIYVSPAYEQVWGQTCESLYANPEGWIHSIHPEDRPHAQAIFQLQIKGEIVENQYRIVQPSGAIRWICDCAFPVRDIGGSIVRVAGVAEDITERKLSELRLIHLALYDELTDLPNRRLFQERLGQAISNCGGVTSGAVFFVDLDQFKLVNDTLGHVAGDQLLKDVSQRFLVACGKSSTLARFGGDEFSVVANCFEGQDSARHLGNELIRCLDRPFRIADRDVFIGASIGVSLFPADGTDPVLLQRNADLAMHEAKRAGKNQVKSYTPVYADRARERMEMETLLRRAIELSEFKLQFQPQFAYGSTRPNRFEALIRWYPLDAAPIPPFKFIPIAEQNGLIVPIGTWVLQEACRRCADWQKGDLKGAGVAVNVSALQFASPDFLDVVARILALTALPGHLLELELTESVLMQDRKASAIALDKLRSLGVTIALDDFGTGYSSLSYLQNLPLDALKIDRTFLVEAESRPQGAAILRCVVELAHTLGLRVVGEGVETITQLDLLASLGCDEIQGYLLGRPSFDVNGTARLADLLSGSHCSIDQAWALVTS